MTEQAEADAKCPCCGRKAEGMVGYCPGGCGKEKNEHFHRECRGCSHVWIQTMKVEGWS